MSTPSSLSTSTTTAQPNVPSLIQKKSQLSLLHQQLLTSLLQSNGLNTSSTNNNNNTNNINTNNTSTLELAQITQQLQSHCDELMLYHYEQQQSIDQQLIQLKQQQLDFERQQREFESSKINNNQNNNITNNTIQQQHQQSQSSVDSFIPNNIQQFSSSPTIPPPTVEVDMTQYMEVFQHVLQDYQSMKYLVEKCTATQELFQQYTTLNEKMKDVDEKMKSVDDIKQLQSKVNAIELQLNKIETNVNNIIQVESQLDHPPTPTQQSLQDQSNQQQLAVAQMIENQRKQVPSILRRNRRSMKSEPNPFIIFQFENCPDIQHSCRSWKDHYSIHDILYTGLINYRHASKLKPLEETIKASKLYISSKSALNGEWIQIQGDGAIVDIKDLQLAEFLKPGDDIYQYDDYRCRGCDHHSQQCDSFETTNRYLIKFKWE